MISETEKLIDQIIEKMTEEQLKKAARVGIIMSLKMYRRAVNELDQIIEIEKEKNNGKG